VPLRISRCTGGDNKVCTTSESIQERVFRVISASKRIPLAAVTPDATFEELAIDSLDRLNILFDLESEFNIEIDDEEAKQATKVSDIVEGIKQLLERSGQPVPGQ
jgi:acyl carrier protein